jgi:hypothetical protein
MAKGYEGIPEMDASPRNMDDDQVQGGSDEQIRDIGEDDDDFDESEDTDEEEEEDDEDGGV